MSVAHIVAFGFSEDLPDEVLRALEDGLNALSSSLPGVRSYRHGRDLGLRPGNVSYAVSAEFDTPEALVAYLEHPDHLSLVDRIRPYVSSRSAVQFQVPTAA